MRPFEYERPSELAQATSLLAEHGPEARPIAGGTDLIIRLRDGSLRPRVVVDMKGIAELDGEIRDDDGYLRFGALTTMTEVAANSRVKHDYPALVESALFVGSVQIRNRATLVGNMCNASPAADTAPALLAYGALIVATGPSGTRHLPLEEFFASSGCGGSNRRSIASPRPKLDDNPPPPSRADGQRTLALDRGSRSPHAPRRPARRPWPDRHEGVLPRRGVRGVHGPPRRPQRRFVPGARRRGGRRVRHDGGGAGPRRPAEPGAARLSRDGPRPMRLLHPGPA